MYFNSTNQKSFEELAAFTLVECENSLNSYM